MKRFFTKTGIWLLGGAAVIAVVLCIISAMGSGTSFLHNALGVIASPFRAAGSAVVNWVDGISDHFASVEELQAENEALRQENAELEALCEQARKNSLLPPEPPQPRVLEQPGLPVIVFHPAAQPPEKEEAAKAAPAPEAPDPKPPQEEERSPFDQPDWRPTTKLDRLSVDIVRQLEGLMGT